MAQVRMSESINVATGIVGLEALDLESGRRLGSVIDIIVNPARGEMLDFLVQSQNFGERVVAWHEAKLESSALLMRECALRRADKINDSLASSVSALRKMVGASVVTDAGKMLGTITEVRLTCDFQRVAYRLKPSGFRGLLGGTLLLPGDTTRAYSRVGNRLIVSDDADQKNNMG